MAEKVAWLQGGIWRWTSAEFEVQKAGAFRGLELRHDEDLPDQLWLHFAAPSAAWATEFSDSVKLALADWSSASGGVDVFANLAALAGKCGCANLADSILQFRGEPCIAWSSPDRLVAAVTACSQAIADHKSLGFDEKLLIAALRLREPPFGEAWRPGNSLGIIEKLALVSIDGIFRYFTMFSRDFSQVATTQPALASRLMRSVFSVATDSALHASIKSFATADLWLVPYMTGSPPDLQGGTATSRWDQPLGGKFLNRDVFLLDWKDVRDGKLRELRVRQVENSILFEALKRHRGETYSSNVTSMEEAKEKLRGK